MRRRLGIALVFLFALGIIATAVAQTTGINDEEVQGFTLPSTNTKGFRVHANRSHMHLSLPAGNIIAVGGYKHVYTFSHGDNLKASVSNANTPIAGTGLRRTAGVLYQPAPYAGSIIGLSIGASTALTAGTATCEATILQGVDGTTVERTGLTVVLDANGAPRYTSTRQARDLDTFTVGDGLGAQLTTSSLFAPVTAEIACTVIAEF